MGNGWSCVKKLEATETPYLGHLNLYVAQYTYFGL
jgi:hypothetical protein